MYKFGRSTTRWLWSAFVVAGTMNSARAQTAWQGGPPLPPPPPGVMPVFAPNFAPGPYVPVGGTEVVQALLTTAASDGAIDASERRLIRATAAQYLHPSQLAQLEAQLSDSGTQQASGVQQAGLVTADGKPCAPLDKTSCSHDAVAIACEENGDCDGLFTNMAVSWGLEGYKGIVDVGLNGNFGTRAGINWGIPLLRSWGIGGQLGASFGGANFNGSATQDFIDIFGDIGETDEVRTQTFITAGLFQRATCGHGLSWGVVYDTVLDDYYAENYLTQWRGEIAWAVNESNAFGVWGTHRDRGDGALILDAFAVQFEFDAIDQVNAFWDRKWECGLDSRVSVGVAEEPGEFVFGFRMHYPMSDYLSLLAAATYVNPSVSGDGDFTEFPEGGIQEEFWNIGIHVVFFPNGKGRSSTVTGHRYMPLQPVADNGSFLTDFNFNVF